MEKFFNNYNLSDEEINKILVDYRLIIRSASKINGKIDEECEQRIMIAVYNKLRKNRK